MTKDILEAEYNRSINLFQSRLRISSAEDPDLYADARPHSAMVARRNGTVPGREAQLPDVLIHVFEKRWPGGQTKLSWEPIAYCTPTFL